MPTDAKFVAQSLYDTIDRGDQVSQITEALEELRRRNLLSYTEKQGYKIQSSAGEEWEREQRNIGVPRETISEMVQDGLKYLLASAERPKLQGAGSPGRAYFPMVVNLTTPRWSILVRRPWSASTSASSRWTGRPRASGCVAARRNR